MNKNQQNVTEFHEKAGQAVNRSPSVPDDKTRALRVQLLLEEVLELAEASGVKIQAKLEYEKNGIPRVIRAGLNKTCKFDFIIDGTVDLVEVADALADIDYVNVGAAVSYGIDLEPCHEEVHESNMTKFIDGRRKADGKWEKGPSYRPADLKIVLELQSEHTNQDTASFSEVEPEHVTESCVKYEHDFGDDLEKDKENY